MGHRIVHDGPIGPGFGVTSDLLSNVPEIVFCSQAFCDEYEGGLTIIRVVLCKSALGKIILLSDFEFMRYAALVIWKKDKRWLGD